MSDQEFRNVFNHEQPETEAPPPKIVPPQDVATLSHTDLQLPDELIPGLLFRGTKMVIAGGSKSYKTWLLQHLAFCASHKIAWLGFKPDRCHVAFCNLELKAPIFNYRCVQIMNALHVHPVAGGFFAFHFRDAGVAPQKLFESLIASVGFQTVDLVIIDPIYKLLGERDENSARDMAALMHQLEQIAATNNCSIIFGHHFPKGSSADKDPLDKLAGSGVFGRDLDSIVTLTPHQEPLCFSAEFVLRNHRPLDPLVFRWDFPLFNLEPALDPSEIKRKMGAPIQYRSNMLLDLIREHDDDLSVSGLQELATEQLGMSRASFYRKWKILIASKKVFISKLTDKVNLASSLTSI